MWTHGTFYWNELMTRDVEAAKAFYGRAIGWTFDGMPMPEGTYWIAKAGDKVVGGIMAIDAPQYAEIPASWFVYLAVDDIDARLAAAAKAGATIVRPTFEVPGIGRIAILRQPDGAHVGWITPAAPPS